MFFIFIWIACQIIGESFPISSSGHCALLEQWYACLYKTLFPLSALDRELLVSIMHIPTLIILALFFYNEWFFLLRHCLRLWRLIVRVGLLTLLAALTTAFFYFGLNMHEWSCFPLGLGLLITAAILASLSWCPNRNVRWQWHMALILGVVQAIALLPGISRLGITYTAARWLGISVRRSLQISFLIQVPLIIGALCLALAKHINHDHMPKVLNLPMVLVMLISTVVAWYGLRYTVALAYNNRWWYFALYLIIPFTAWLVLIMCS